MFSTNRRLILDFRDGEFYCQCFFREDVPWLPVGDLDVLGIWVSGQALEMGDYLAIYADIWVLAIPFALAGGSRCGDVRDACGCGADGAPVAPAKSAGIRSLVMNRAFAPSVAKTQEKLRVDDPIYGLERPCARIDSLLETNPLTAKSPFFVEPECLEVSLSENDKAEVIEEFEIDVRDPIELWVSTDERGWPVIRVYPGGGNMRCEKDGADFNDICSCGVSEGDDVDAP
ncbi:MAG: hypothetical protein H6818_10915 [Phycisphaerales bacterium]|nr:hypothetical protein [Phycisphaerales bacterium]